MKKIFKIASLLFCAGALVVYTGCTKESGSGDVSELTKKVEDLSKQINSQADQISVLESTTTLLSSAQTALEEDIIALQKAKKELEEGKADKTQVDALDKAIKSLQTIAEKNKQDIATINADIAAIKSGKADRTWVEQTYATITYVQGVESTLGQLKGTVDDLKDVVIPGIQAQISGINSQIVGINDELTAINGKLTQLRTDVDAAASKAAEALGEIDIIKGWFDNYYKKGEVDQKIVDLKGELNQTITAKVGQLQEKDTELKGLIDAQATKINELVDALAAKADKAYVDQIKSDLTALQKKVDESVAPDVTALLAAIKAVQVQVAGVAVRVTSIVACPSLTEEFATITIGNTLSGVLCADFEIKPADKVDEIVNAFKEKKSPVTLRYSHARSRSVTKASASEISINEAKITDLRKNDNGTLRVIATGFLSKIRPSSSCLFYSLGYEAEDSAGVYSVCSDYTQAIEASEEFVLDSLVQYANIDAAGKITFLAAHDKDYVHETRYNYVAAETAIHQPWLGDTLAFNANVKMPSEKAAFLKKIFNKEDGAYTFQEVNKLAGLYVSVKYNKITVNTPVNFEFKGFNTTINFVPMQGKSMYEYVSETPYPASIKYEFNDTEMKGCIVEKYYITKIEHPVVTLPDTTIYWNYKQYWNAHRHVTVDFSKAREGYDPSKWNEAITKGAEVTKDFIQINLYRYKDITTGYQPLTVSIDSAYYERQLCYKSDISAFAKCVKESKSDKYTFKVTTCAKKALIKDVKAEKQTVTGHITKADTVVIKNFVDLYIKNSAGAIEPSLIEGLTGDDILYANVKAAFLKQFETSPYTILTDSKDITEDVKVKLIDNQDLRLIVKAGIFAYDQSADIVVKYTKIFGRTYTVTQPITTTSPKFKLGTKNWIDPATKIGTAIGAFKQGVYTLEDMFYNKQVELCDVDKLNAAETVVDEDVVVKFTVTPTTAGATGAIGNEAGAAGIKVNTSDGSLYTGLLTWGAYNGLEFKVSAQLYIKNVKAGDPIEYTIQTKKPVRYVSNSHNPYSRKPAEDLEIVLYKNAIVYGIINNEEVAQNIVKADGTISKYPNTEFEYAEPKDWTVTLNGSAPTSWVAGVDYEWNKDKATIKIMGDNLQGELKITVGSKLKHYLDANKPQELPIQIKVNSAKNN